MSIIIRRANGSIQMLAKGAESVIYDLCIDGTKAAEEHVQNFSRMGLRTLVLAHKDIDVNTFEEWNTKYQEACKMVSGKEEIINKLEEEIENGLHCVGVTGVEDVLQHGVPETVESLKRAGIKIWIATGDRSETALNIAKSCRLISNETVETLTLDNLTTLSTIQNECYSLVITGNVFEQATDEEKKEILRLAIKANSVIWCRTTPAVKASILKHVKKYTKQVCLAIGDGGNDVAMIKEANVGVGIFGKEGYQAAQSSDFSIRKFRHLQKLLFYHGHNNLRGMSFSIKTVFYKGVTFGMMQFWFGFLTGFSGQTIYEDFMVTFFNFFITRSLPLFAGVWANLLAFDSLKNYPEIYKESTHRGKFASIWSFVLWVLFAIYQSIAIFFCYYYFVIQTEITGLSGRVNGWGTSSSIMAWMTILTTIITMGLSVKRFELFRIFGFANSLYALVVSTMIISFLPVLEKSVSSNGTFFVLIRQPTFYLIVLFTVLICCSPLIVKLYYDRLVNPKLWQIIQEFEPKEGKSYGKKRDFPLENSDEAEEFFRKYCKPKPFDNFVKEIEMVSNSTTVDSSSSTPYFKNQVMSQSSSRELLNNSNCNTPNQNSSCLNSESLIKQPNNENQKSLIEKKENSSTEHNEDMSPSSSSSLIFYDVKEKEVILDINKSQSKEIDNASTTSE
ncbi:Phospholipid-transporting ATPase [Entamoeba marina]